MKFKAPNAFLLARKEVQQSVRRAVKFLKTRLSKTPAFQQMPWYLVIGLSKAGKTQLILKSELSFLEKNHFVTLTPEGMETNSGINWWFSPGAVLIDVPGIYMKESTSPTPTSTAWLELLHQIRRARPRCPLNGIVLVMEATSLQRNVTAWIAPKLQDILHQFKQRLPVYVIITQMDQLQGFHVYFDDLGKNERQQCCGLTLALENKENTAWTTLFSEAFDQWLLHLHQRMLWRIHQEKEASIQRILWDFPQQLHALKENLNRLIYSLTPFKSSILPRGVYFTSSLANHTPSINLTANAIKKSFGMLPAATSSSLSLKPQRPFFIKALFEQHIFPEAQLSQDILRTSPPLWHNFAQWGMIGIAGMTLFSLLFFFTQQYKTQTLHLNIAQTALSEYTSLAADFDKTPPPMDKLLTALNALALTHQSASLAYFPWLLSFKLHPHGSLSAMTAQLYTHALQTQLIPAVRNKLAETLQQGQITNSAQLYSLLKIYLMLGDPQHADKTFLHHWFYQEWQDPLMQNQNFRKHWEAAIKGQMPSLSSDITLVENSRATLNALPYSLLSHAILQTDLFEIAALPAIKLKEIPFFHINSPPVSSLFTAAYVHHVQTKMNNALVAALQGNWVLGNKTPTNIPTESLQVSQHALLYDYAQTYQQAWSQFLSGIQINTFHSLQEIEHALDILTANHSPFESLLATVQKNTDFQTSQNALTTALSQVLTPEFDALNNLSLQPLQATLKNLKTQIQEITHSQHADEKSLQVAQHMATQQADAIQTLIQQAKTLPFPFNQWLLSLAYQSRDLILARAAHTIRQQWQSQVLPLCQATITHHYPFEKSASQEISLADFARFFEKEGIFDQFFTMYLSAFVQTNQPQWHWKTIDGTTLTLDTHFLSQFERANLIQTLYFNANNQLTASFSLTRNTDIHHYTWPVDTQNLSLTYTDTREKQQTLTARGDWSVFRLIDSGTLKPHADGNTYDLTFNNTTYLLSASPLNPFVSDIVEHFQCP